MGQLNLSYGDLWAFYRQSNQDVRDNILEQLDLDNWMSACTIRVRKEIMAEAPIDVAQKYTLTRRTSSQLGFLFGRK